MTNTHTKNKNSAKRLFKAFYHSTCGLRAVFQNEVAFRQEVFLSIIIIPLALIFGVTAVERSILIGCWVLVLLMEVINSAIETVVDRISLEIHPLSKKIKDISSAAVLLSVINAITIWIIILVG